jgi:hypothetical protein
LFVLHVICKTDNDVEVVHNGNIVGAKFCYDSVIEPGFCFIRMVIGNNTMGKFHITCISHANAVSIDDHQVATTAIPPVVPQDRSRRSCRRPSFFSESTHSAVTRTAGQRSIGRNVRRRVDSESVSGTSTSEKSSEDNFSVSTGEVQPPDVDNEYDSSVSTSDPPSVEHIRFTRTAGEVQPPDEDVSEYDSSVSTSDPLSVEHVRLTRTAGEVQPPAEDGYNGFDPNLFLDLTDI